MFRRRRFLDHDKLAEVARLRKAGKLSKAEKILMRADPTPAVLDELRKIASIRASEAKKNGDWAAVARHLEGYMKLANKWRSHCIKLVNQEPPPLTSRDQKLLKDAKSRLGK